MTLALIPPDADPPLLIVYGAAKRKVLHLSVWRRGTWVPICNAHYTASHDVKARRVREPEGKEADYPICKRCEAWKRDDD